MTTAQHPRLDSIALRVLRLLLDLAKHDRAAHVGTIARQLDIGRTQAADALVRLDRAGLVRAEHARLTMSGLVIATRLSPLALRSPALVSAATKPSQRARATKAPAGWLRATGT